MADPQTLDELRPLRDQLGADIRSKHIALERSLLKLSDADAAKADRIKAAAEKAGAELRDMEARWKELNAKVRDLETD